ncbi:hypothetical protein BgAZ_202170 [Babesia gibsoni]|uniref:Uncharacterized protein n=1 Tax=Babesia gibsoni TaxID=33632 RepID=A0AAD8PE68_BABGI|nr:hypothetical protein BgAZ_202170 [Babesia gibsoni]
MRNFIRIPTPRAGYVRGRTNVHQAAVLQNEGATDRSSPIGLLKDPTARVLASNLAKKSPFIRTSVYSPLQEAISRARVQHPDHVIAIWTGKGYELHGSDAVLCVEHCDMRPIGLTPHVELPEEQLTVVSDKLKRIGYNVAVYNYVAEVQSGDNGDAFVQRKSLVFSHVLPSDTVTRELAESGDGDGTVVGVTYDKSGYSISIICPRTCVMQIRERLTLPAATSLLQTTNTRVVIFQNGNRHVKKLLSHVTNVIHYEPIQGNLDSQGFHKAVCANVKGRLNITRRFKVKVIAGVPAACSLDRETALAFGLCSETGEGTSKIKPLHLQLLPDDAPSYMKQYMMFILTRVLPHEVAEDIRYVNSKLSKLPLTMNYNKPITSTKVMAMASQQRVELSHILDIHQTLGEFKYYMEALPPAIAKKLFNIAASDLNVQLNMERVKKDLNECIYIIGSLISCEKEESDAVATGIPSLDDLFRQSGAFTKRIRRNLMIREREQVEDAACELLSTIASDYLGMSPEITEDATGNSRLHAISDIVYKHITSREDKNKSILVNDHFVLLNSINNTSDHTKLKTIETVIGSERKLCYCSKNVTEALVNYRNKCSLANAKANAVITDTRNALAPHVQSIVMMSHILVILQTLSSHVGVAVTKGWAMPSIIDGSAIAFANLMPQHIATDDTLPFSVEINGVHVLPGPNNSGRSTCIATLISSCMAANRGFYIPCNRVAKVPRLTKFFYHDISFNNHTQPTSSFDHNMKSIENILNLADSSTFIAIDNLGSDLIEAKAKGFSTCVIKKIMEKASLAVISTNITSINRGDIPEAHFSVLTRNKDTVTLEETNDCSYYRGVSSDNSFFKTIEDHIQQSPVDNDGEETLLTSQGPQSTKDSKDKQGTSFGIILDRIPSKIMEGAKAVTWSINEIFGCTLKNDIVHVLEDGMPPPMLNNVPVLYTLLIPIVIAKGAKQYQTEAHEGGKNYTTAVYVGETGNLFARLKTHRVKPPTAVEEYLSKTYMHHQEEMTEYLKSKNEIDVGHNIGILAWDKLHVIAVKMPSRMEARINERKLINKLYSQHSDIVILSHRDGVYREIEPVD